MSVIPVNFDDVQEPQPAPAGRYDLVITGAELAKTGPNSKNPGSPQFKVSIGLPDELNAPNLTQYISLPSEFDDKRSSDYKQLLLKRFLIMFKVPFSNTEIDTEKMAMDMVGCTATGEVQLTDPDDKGNVYNRLVVPRISTEASGPSKAPGRRR